ncbi:tripartite motif-containing protein 16-like isoform X2 [Seriola lalandi dorsalis]|uniref:Tripartite motif-containing protein 16-like n=1 Tax=Seriola lalandi dorsalis TaxID=1841481 RepID=A0A3B4YKJ5_SERLL|nr:tripartite motif-containing protein 16-like isoform X2 [Seriola lalandi dorsalis]
MATLSSNSEENLNEVQHNASVKEEPEDPTIQTSDILLSQDVMCDSCMDSPSKALKSCLTCLVSYCEAHLRPHLENIKFQNHRLVDPRHDIDCRTCEVHQLPLERFCLTDGCCVCLDCESQEHEGHTIASIGEACSQIEAEMQKKQEEISQSTSAAERAIEKLQSNNDLIKSSVQEICVLVEEQFARMQATVEEARKGAMEVLEGEQRQALRQAEGIQAHLEQKRTGLMKTLAQMNKMSRSKSDIDFLQEYSDWKKGVADVRLPNVYVNRMDYLTSYVQVVTDATQELCDLILSSYRDKLSMFCKGGTKLTMPESQLSSLPDPETREDFLKYTKSLTFDPDTTHHFLRVTEDNRKLTNTSPWQHSYPDHPDRFEYWRQAITSQSVYLGRHYIEAELSGEGAHVGVTYKSIDRKGEQSACCITGNDFSWCMGRNSRGFFTWHAGLETALEVTDIKRIGLYVDFHQGSVSFYGVTGPMRLLHKYKADFIEPLYVTVWLSKKDNVVSLVKER